MFLVDAKRRFGKHAFFFLGKKMITEWVKKSLSKKIDDGDGLMAMTINNNNLLLFINLQSQSKATQLTRFEKKLIME